MKLSKIYYFLFVTWIVSNAFAGPSDGSEFAIEFLAMFIGGYSVFRYQKTNEEFLKWVITGLVAVIIYLNLPVAIHNFGALIDDLEWYQMAGVWRGRIDIGTVSHWIFNVLLAYFLYRVLSHSKDD